MSVEVTVDNKKYTLPVVVIRNTRLYRGIEADDCASVEQYRSSLPYVWMTTDPRIARNYGNCIFKFDPRPEGTALRLLDIWRPPVIEMMDELISNRSNLFNTLAKLEAWYIYTGRGLKPTSKDPSVKKIGPIIDSGGGSSSSEGADALAIFEGSQFVDSSTGGNSGSSLKWRGLLWGDKPGEFSRYSAANPDKLVTAIFFEIIKGTKLDGLYAPGLPSFMHETISVRNVFDEEFIILKDSLNAKYNPPERLTSSGGRRKTHKLIRRRRVRKTRHTLSNIPVSRTRHVQRKI